jgi:hypothetical protein
MLRRGRLLPTGAVEAPQKGPGFPGPEKHAGDQFAD